MGDPEVLALGLATLLQDSFSPVTYLNTNCAQAHKRAPTDTSAHTEAGTHTRRGAYSDAYVAGLAGKCRRGSPGAGASRRKEGISARQREDGLAAETPLAPGGARSLLTQPPPCVGEAHVLVSFTEMLFCFIRNGVNLKEKK